MDNRAHVPKFGDWDKQTDAPYTVVFDNARKKRNPYDPKENSELSSNQGSPPRPPRTPTPVRPEPANQTPKQRSQGHRQNREDGDIRRFAPSPANNDRSNRARAPQGPPSIREPYNNNNHPYGGRGLNQAETNRRTPPQNPRPLPNVRHQQPYRAPAIPPFPGQGGKANVENMSYTHIFDKVREDKNQEGGRPIRGNSPHTTPSRPINNLHAHSSPTSPKSCCFPWSRKGKY